MVVENCRTFGDEVHFREFLAVGHNCLSWFVDSAVHTDDQLMLETCIRVQEETVEMALECLEK